MWLTVGEDGFVEIELDLTNKGWGFDHGAIVPPHVLDEGRLESNVRHFLRYVAALYDEFDQHRRFESFFFDASLFHAHGATLERDPQPRSTYAVSSAYVQDRSAPVLPLKEPRQISRDDLTKSDDEISRFITYLKRSLERERR